MDNKKLKLHIAHLYPKLLNIYGDWGNILTIKKRCAWRNIETVIDSIDLNDNIDIKKYDIYFIGGGQDKQQITVSAELQKHKLNLLKARDNNAVKLRAEMINIKELYMGQKNKVLALSELIEKYGLSYDEIAYMGDDLPDICVLEKVGLRCCPLDAVQQVKEKCNFISSFNGGRGAVRELCDFILKSKEITYEMISKPTKQ